MVDRAEFERWRDEATRALDSARVQSDAGFWNWACFGAEQAAQLAVKALLHGLAKAPWGHDLVRLGAAAAAEMAAGWPADLDPVLRRLSRHYIPSRYPDAHPGGGPSDHYGAEDADAAIEDAAKVLSGIDTVWAGLAAEDGRG